jgi:flagellar FliJ protein
MKKFQFKLQRLLDFKETREDLLLTELGIAQNNVAREAVKLSDITYERSICRERLKNELSTGNPDNILDNYRYLNHIVSEESLQRDRVKKAEEQKGLKTLELIDASKERKVLENLKERKNDEYKQEVESNEQKFLDDIASFKRGGISLHMISNRQQQ